MACSHPVALVLGNDLWSYTHSMEREMNEQQIAAVKQALDALNMGSFRNEDVPFIEHTCDVLRQALREDALDKMAENARELGLDYDDEPVAWMDCDGDLYATEPDKNWCPPHYPLYTHPANQVAEPRNMDEIQRLSALVRAQQITIDKLEHQPAKPDYKALWQQMCERCDELDKELAATDRQLKGKR